MANGMIEKKDGAEPHKDENQENGSRKETAAKKVFIDPVILAEIVAGQEFRDSAVGVPEKENITVENPEAKLKVSEPDTLKQKETQEFIPQTKPQPQPDLAAGGGGNFTGTDTAVALDGSADRPGKDVDTGATIKGYLGSGDPEIKNEPKKHKDGSEYIDFEMVEQNAPANKKSDPNAIEAKIISEPVEKKERKLNVESIEALKLKGDEYVTLDKLSAGEGTPNKKNEPAVTELGVDIYKEPPVKKAENTETGIALHKEQERIIVGEGEDAQALNSQQFEKFQKAHNKEQPQHGNFVAGDSAADTQELSDKQLDRLKKAYSKEQPQNGTFVVGDSAADTQSLNEKQLDRFKNTGTQAKTENRTFVGSKGEDTEIMTDDELDNFKRAPQQQQQTPPKQQQQAKQEPAKEKVKATGGETAGRVANNRLTGNIGKTVRNMGLGALGGFSEKLSPGMRRGLTAVAGVTMLMNLLDEKTSFTQKIAQLGSNLLQGDIVGKVTSGEKIDPKMMMLTVLVAGMSHGHGMSMSNIMQHAGGDGNLMGLFNGGAGGAGVEKS